MTYLTRRQIVARAAAFLVAPAAPAMAMTPIRITDLNQEEEGITDLARSLMDTRIGTFGFMTPPLSHRAPFFVLSAQPLGTCPVCDDIADYPHSIVTVLMTKTFLPVPFWKMIEVVGVLRIGEHIDPETGFASPIHLEDVRISVP